jgi:hypothetical protein
VIYTTARITDQDFSRGATVDDDSTASGRWFVDVE